MAKNRSDFDALDTPYEVQPVAGSAEGPIDYGQVTSVTKKGGFNDPMGVLPVDATKGKNIGPGEGEG
jgi:hypothetical protein